MWKLLMTAATLAVVAVLPVACRAPAEDQPQEKPAVKSRPLTPEEERVIVQAGTERPFTGKYNDYFAKGTYTCRRCGAALYRSDDKFKSHCGWPSFDDEIKGAVERIADPDGQRTEIRCKACGAHLGHVFLGEQLTGKNVRHCVNSVSLEFVAADQDAKTLPATAKAIFAGGCFWGLEYYFVKAPGVISTTVGYTGGTVERPTYQQVCGGHTGHLEAIEIVFDPTKTTYEALTRLFFETHDPTQADGQGPDIGEQYRSAVFYLDDNQKAIAEKLLGQLGKKGYRVVTRVVKAGTFWPAEDYHQDYYEKHGKTPYCHIPTSRF